jgi:hypothetical protein
MNKGTPIEQLPNVKMNIQEYTEEPEEYIEEQEYTEEPEYSQDQVEENGEEHNEDHNEEDNEVEQVIEKPGLLKRMFKKLSVLGPVIYQILLYAVIITCFYELYTYSYTTVILKNILHNKPISKSLEYMFKFALALLYSSLYSIVDGIYMMF